jgi:hypothetical protein
VPESVEQQGFIVNVECDKYYCEETATSIGNSLVEARLNIEGASWTYQGSKTYCPAHPPLPQRRGYCDRVGGVVNLEGSEPCGECGSTGHETLPEGICGEYVTCVNPVCASSSTLPHGHNCTRITDHEGAHQYD